MQKARERLNVVCFFELNKWRLARFQFLSSLRDRNDPLSPRDFHVELISCVSSDKLGTFGA
jgi:hypothetical protein